MGNKPKSIIYYFWSTTSMLFHMETTSHLSYLSFSSTIVRCLFGGLKNALKMLRLSFFLMEIVDDRLRGFSSREQGPLDSG